MLLGGLLHPSIVTPDSFLVICLALIRLRFNTFLFSVHVLVSQPDLFVFVLHLLAASYFLRHLSVSLFKVP